MSDKFLLECSCGKQVQVTRSQAGSQVECACRKPLEVPPLRKLVHLPPVDEIAAVEGPIWNLNRGLIFLGAVIAVPALVFAGYLYFNLPQTQRKQYRALCERNFAGQAGCCGGFTKMACPSNRRPTRRPCSKALTILGDTSN